MTFSENAVDQIARFPVLNSLDFDHTNLTDDGLRRLIPLESRLIQLRLSNSKVTDAGLDSLGRFPALRFVGLSGAEFTDAAIPCLQQLKSLTTLRISGTSVTGEDPDAWSKLTSLTMLIADGAPFSDKGLQNLCSLKLLRRVYLSQTQITDEGLQGFSGFPGLILLDLRDTPVTKSAKAKLRGARPGLEVW